MAKSIRVPGSLNSFDRRTESAIRHPKIGDVSRNVEAGSIGYREEVRRQRIACGLEKPEVAEAVGV